MRLLTTLITALYLSLTAYSQSIVIDGSDTLICFTSDKSKFLAKEHYRANAYFLSDSLCNLEKLQKDRQIKMYIKIEDKLQGIINNQNSITKLKDEELKVVKLSLQLATKEIKKQKTYKLLSILGGAILSGYLMYKN